MPWDLNYVPQEATVVIVHNGPLSVDEATQQARAVVALLKATKSRRVFIDHSRLSGSLSAIDIRNLTDYYGQLHAPASLRIALVLPRDEEGRHFDVFHKLLCDPKGFSISLFQSKELAQAWLHEEPLSRGADLPNRQTPADRAGVIRSRPSPP